MRSKPTLENLVSPRIGFHYFGDTDHYTNQDLNTWLPRLQQIHAKWLIIRSDTSRAVPEHFLSEMIRSGITPIIHMELPLPNTPSAGDLKSILEVYSRWGVKQVILFNKPNTLQAWSASGWSQQDLVERFIDRFIPLATAVVQAGMTPVFPPLQPGGNYWDLIFLRQSLQSILRRGFSSLIKQMALASYAYTYNHELDWGMGGQEKWSKSKPYTKSEENQDQCGFNNFEWLQRIALQTSNKEMPILLLGAGIKESGKGYSPEIHAEIVKNILERLNGVPESRNIPSYVQCCNFYLLGAEPGSDEYPNAWFKSDNETLPIVGLISSEPDNPELLLSPVENETKSLINSSDENPSHPLEHYLLLPLYEWGIADFHLEVTRPFIQKYHPTVGFSSQDALLAKQITVVGGENEFPEALLNQLREGGCVVERIHGDGTSIATQLAER